MTTATPQTARFKASSLVDFARQALCHAGLERTMAQTVAQALIDADAMGHSTHGLALLSAYLEAAQAGHMALSGQPTVVNDRGSCVTWDGHLLPGAWLIDQATDLALARVATHGVVTIAIRNSHHTGALAVYLPKVTQRGLMVQLHCSSPSALGVAPYGGTKGLFSPNPVATGYPTQGDPVLLDISASITTLNSARQLKARGERFPAAWAMDAQGLPSDDPASVIGGGGSLLPTGGMDHGHKGYAMALVTDALTQGLSGYGRADQPKTMSLSVLLQVIDPNAFAGLDAFTHQTSWTAEACRTNPPRPGGPAVRLPGQKALANQRQADVAGVPLQASVVAQMLAIAGQTGVVWPSQAQ